MVVVLRRVFVRRSRVDPGGIVVVHNECPGQNTDERLLGQGGTTARVLARTFCHISFPRFLHDKTFSRRCLRPPTQGDEGPRSPRSGEVRSRVRRPSASPVRTGQRTRLDSSLMSLSYHLGRPLLSTASASGQFASLRGGPRGA